MSKRQMSRFPMFCSAVGCIKSSRTPLCAWKRSRRSGTHGTRRGQVQPGDRVAGLTTFVGGMADVAAVAPEMVFQLPDNISMEA
jgi:hypothetical protein